jgi:hypothetical protein
VGSEADKIGAFDPMKDMSYIGAITRALYRSDLVDLRMRDEMKNNHNHYQSNKKRQDNKIQICHSINA